MSKLAVITGGTKGIGRALLDRFAMAGFDLATCSRNTDELTRLAAEVRLKYGVATHVMQADLSKPDQAERFTSFVSALDLPVDVLVNNAGYFEPGKVSEETKGTLERMIQTNLYSAYYTTRGLIEGMKRRQAGHIFNMCSIASIMAYPNGGSYSISKFALLGFTKVLREEMKPFKIRVTAVLPGATRTSSWDGVNLPDERFMKASDVAEAVFGAYSLSPQSVVEEILIRPQLGDI